jgi:hypothetical protein
MELDKKSIGTRDPLILIASTIGAILIGTITDELWKVRSTSLHPVLTAIAWVDIEQHCVSAGHDETIYKQLATSVIDGLA